MESQEEILEGNRERERVPTYCVTGATGYIGSWLVKTLLDRGYKVHATVRDPGQQLLLKTLPFACFFILWCFWLASRFANKRERECVRFWFDY